MFYLLKGKFLMHITRYVGESTRETRDEASLVPLSAGGRASTDVSRCLVPAADSFPSDCDEFPAVSVVQ